MYCIWCAGLPALAALASLTAPPHIQSPEQYMHVHRSTLLISFTLYTALARQLQTARRT